MFNAENHLIQIPAALDTAHFNLALDIGTPVTFIAAPLLDNFSLAHPQWPSLYGAVGIANLWGLDDEPDWRLLKISNLRYGDISIPTLIAVSFPKNRLDYFQKRAGVPTAGLMDAASLLNYQLGIDYAHGRIYLQRLTKPTEPDMDLIGLVLRPETSGGYRILGAAPFHGQPAVGVHKGDLLLKVDGKETNGLTMGAIWSLLHGPPGTRKKLTLQRGDRKITVVAVTHRFLAG